MLTAAAVTSGALALGALVQRGSGRRLRWALQVYLILALANGLAVVVEPTGLGVLGFTLWECTLTAGRLMIAFELVRDSARARYVFLSGLVVLLLILVATVSIAAGTRATFRNLALGASGAGLLLLSVRAVAAFELAEWDAVERAASAGLGSYLLLHGALLGAATEASATGESLGAALSPIAWSLWALWLAICAWVGPVGGRT